MERVETPKSDYEELRKARIFENQARLASIGLSKTLSELRSLRQVRPWCKIDYRSKYPLRHSARLSGNPPPSQGNSWFALEKLIRKERRVSKSSRVKWKSMSDEEKAPFVAELEMREEKYEQEMEAYETKLAGNDDDDDDDDDESEYHRRRASMATEELNKPPSLPPYPQMIMEAIDDLKQTEGARIIKTRKLRRNRAEFKMERVETPKSDYEELRKARISENQARLASIGLSKTLSELRSLRQVRPWCKIDYRSKYPLRHSARLSGDPPPSQGNSWIAVEKLIRKERRASKASGVKWKSMSNEEKAPFVAELEMREEKYEREMEAYVTKLAGNDDDDDESEYHRRRASMATEELNKPPSLPPYPRKDSAVQA